MSDQGIPAAAPVAEHAERERWGRTELAHLLLLGLATVLLWLPRLRGPIDLRFDAGAYYVLGTSLAEGKGYRFLNEPGEILAIQYPPLLATWVAAHQRVLGTHDPLIVGQALRVTSFLLALLYPVLAYALARRWVGPKAALFSAALAAFYFHTLYLEDLLFAEVPFALAATGFFVARGARSPRLRVIAYPLSAAAFFLRSAGIALFAAWSLEALLAREWKPFLARSVLGASCVLAWQGYVSSVVSAPEYRQPAYEYQRAAYQFYNVSYAENMALIDPFTPELGRVSPGLLARRVLASTPRLVVGLGESVSAPRGFWEWPLRSIGHEFDTWIPRSLVLAPLALLGFAVVAGLGLLVRRGERALPLFVLCSLGIIALLPWPRQIPRYLTPLAPLLSLGLTLALVALRTRTRAAPAALACLVLAVQGFTLKQTMSGYHHELEYPNPGGAPARGSLFLFDEADAWRQFYVALQWLAANTAPDALVATSCPHLVWLHAQRKAIMPPMEADPESEARLLESAGVDYLIVDELAFVDIGRRYARPGLERHPERWELVYSDPAGSVSIHRRRR